MKGILIHYAPPLGPPSVDLPLTPPCPTPPSLSAKCAPIIPQYRMTGNNNHFLPAGVTWHFDVVSSPALPTF